jgi:hypothetical protein
MRSEETTKFHGESIDNANQTIRLILFLCHRLRPHLTFAALAVWLPKDVDEEYSGVSLDSSRFSFNARGHFICGANDCIVS